MLKDRRTYEIMRARGRRRAAGDAGPRQALGPSRGAAALRAARHHARSPRARSRLPRASSRYADREKLVNDADLLKIVETVRTPGAPDARCSRRRSTTSRPPRPRRVTATACDTLSILLLPGDGIGPEVVAAAERVLRAVARSLRSSIHLHDRRHRRRRAEAGTAAAARRDARRGASGGRDSARRGRRSGVRYRAPGAAAGSRAAEDPPRAGPLREPAAGAGLAGPRVGRAAQARGPRGHRPARCSAN